MAAWLSWCAANRLAAPVLPASAERRREHLNATRAVPRPAIERALSRRDLPLREKTLWRMLYETAARASEVLALTIEDPGLDARRAPHQLRHSAATHLGEQGIPLQLIMAKTRHRSPRTAMRYVPQSPKPSLRSPPCSNLHADEAKQYPPTLRPAASSWHP